MPRHYGDAKNPSYFLGEFGTVFAVLIVASATGVAAWEGLGSVPTTSELYAFGDREDQNVKRTLVAAVVLVLCASVAAAATINIKVVTDCTTYVSGSTVNWTIYAWGNSGETHGISLLAVDLTESRGETLSKALKSGVNLLGSIYTTDNGFAIIKAGILNNPGSVLDIEASQVNGGQIYNIGNDGAQHVFAKGSFTAIVLGSHTLSATETSGGAANYWGVEYLDTDPEYDIQQAVDFETTSLTSAVFTVTEIPEPATLTLLGVGLAGLAAWRRRSR